MRPGLLSTTIDGFEVPTEKMAEALVASAANFLASGGVVSLTEWAAMPSEERRALHVAAGQIAVENARTLAREILRAQLDPNSLLGVAAPPEKVSP